MQEWKGVWCVEKVELDEVELETHPDQGQLHKWPPNKERDEYNEIYVYSGHLYIKVTFLLRL